MTIRHSCLLHTRGIVLPPILLLLGGWHMVSGGSDSINEDYDRTGLGENHQSEGGRVRTGKDADVKEVDAESNGEGLALP